MLSVVADVVVLSEIKFPLADVTATVALAIFLIVISRPAPTVEALGNLIVFEVAEPEKIMK